MDQTWGVGEGNQEDPRGVSSEHPKTEVLTCRLESLTGGDAFGGMASLGSFIVVRTAKHTYTNLQHTQALW